jgi:hypothetical protein
MARYTSYLTAPNRDMITWTGIPVENEPIEDAKRVPTDKESHTEDV